MAKETRVEQVFTRLTKKERKKAQQLADQADVTLSTWIQGLIQRAKK